MSTPAPAQLLVLIDDAAPMPPLVELSSSLARGLSRTLDLVYVESLPALKAAALPFAQVLAYGGTHWQPFAQQDLERAYRAQASRLREMTERAALRHSLHWSMRVVRGALAQAALELRAQADLLLVAGAPPAASRRKRRLAVTVVADHSPAGERAVEVGRQVARAMDALLTVRQGAAEAELRSAPADSCDLLVLPGALLPPQALERLDRPVLLVD